MTTSVFDHPEFDNHEQIVFCRDEETGLEAIIAIHNTNLGPSVGGCRMYPYASAEAALTDVLRLSKGMTYKSSISGLNFGGGKSVIIGDPKTIKTPALLRAMGRFIERCNGAYIVAEDMNISPHDLEIITRETQHVCGLETLGSSGNPSPVTAHGVYAGIKRTVQYKLGKDSLKGVKIAVQGVGSVGGALCQELAADGAELFIADVNQANLDTVAGQTGARIVSLNEIFGLDVDVLAPCAIGGIINDHTLPQIKAPIIAGAANNQLGEARHGNELHKRGILYAPDYVINAGGIVNIHREFYNKPYSRPAAMKAVESIGATLERVFEFSRQHNVPTHVAADRVAEERFKKKLHKEAAA